ncbi:MAG: tRNA (adenosine(37)-N6)-threonylcarbamoyltransferase complex dimerization subunit type 1 TsaB [Thermodesulfobacteriota bacterium]|nr:tRNA (adenosine(37)-N6)-threonylcarbamoyltransferase complex dimerization subunit type 1 TsaB [Thermodesulfobacteriota bacterium]
MKILAVDTATFSCGLALAADDQILFQSAHISRQTHSRRLMPMIDAALKTTGLTLDGLNGFAVTKGPGSFTGLRIGISTVKGLAAVADKPVAGISSLDALAWPFVFTAMPVCVLMDARKSEVYTCRYQNDGNTLARITEEQALPPAEALQGLKTPHIVVGSGVEAYRDLIRETAGENAVPAMRFQHIINPAIVAHLGMQQLKNGTASTAGTITPVYLRQPDAVINR